MNEFALIERYFLPLSNACPDSLRLADDAAILTPPAGDDLVVTKDAIAESVHYLPGTDPALVARKLLRTNLSDLAAMGAVPYRYFLAMALPPGSGEAYLAAFARGFAEDQLLFGGVLVGGDSIVSPGGAVLSLTALGLVPHGKAIRRSGAQPGDALYVSGTLGEAALGLYLLQDQNTKTPYAPALIHRYHVPEPRLALGQILRGVATSAMDISDGLLQDLGHLCRASGVGAEVWQEALPLSEAAAACLQDHPELFPYVYGGGDDYELLFTLPADQPALPGTTHIGRIRQEPGVDLVDHGKIQIPLQAGYRHHL